jgi:uncharacterized protein YndB with AHSA1/START domain
MGLTHHPCHELFPHDRRRCRHPRSSAWKTSMTEPLVVRRKTAIAAPPATVFAFLTDPDKILSWMGAGATTEAHPGGLYLVKGTGDRTHVARGAFREVVPVHRLAHSFGWEGNEAVPPGSSLVEIDLIDQDGGALLRVTHPVFRTRRNAPTPTGVGRITWADWPLRQRSESASFTTTLGLRECIAAERFGEPLKCLVCTRRGLLASPRSPDGGSLRGHTAGSTKHIRIKDVVLQHCEFYSTDRCLSRRKDADNQGAAPPYVQVRRVEKVACDNRAMDGKLILIDERDFSDQEAALTEPVLSTYGESFNWTDRIKLRLRCSSCCK